MKKTVYRNETMEAIFKYKSVIEQALKKLNEETEQHWTMRIDAKGNLAILPEVFK